MVIAALRGGALEELALMTVLEARHARTTLASGTIWSGVLEGEVETDVAGTVDGLLVIGEAKSNSKIDQTQVDDLAALGKKVQARQLVFATGRPTWNEAKQSMFLALETPSNGFGVELISDVIEQARGIVNA
jgi:hypothetical protein